MLVWYICWLLMFWIIACFGINKFLLISMMMIGMFSCLSFTTNWLFFWVYLSINFNDFWFQKTKNQNVVIVDLSWAEFDWNIRIEMTQMILYKILNTFILRFWFVDPSFEMMFFSNEIHQKKTLIIKTIIIWEIDLEKNGLMMMVLFWIFSSIVCTRKHIFKKRQTQNNGGLLFFFFFWRKFSKLMTNDNNDDDDDD